MSQSFSPPYPAAELGDDTPPMPAIGQVTWSLCTSRSPGDDHVSIPQYLQRDSVGPIGRHDPLPNLLHVSYREAARLLGP
jgi:hypothetical protein